MLNGFGVIDDARGYFALPSDVMTRALRGRARGGQIASRLFSICRGLRRVPRLRGWASDELTVLTQRDGMNALGFQRLRVRASARRAASRPEQ